MGIKWMIKKSDFYEVRKSVNKEADSKKLEQLKKEVIAILEKKDSQEYKKAIEHFEKDESKYSRLEKSVTGEWIEKAGYGVGTVRIWKGKKYKKVSTSPTRWVRVFDKNDHGAATSMGKYIAQVKKCNSIEELYQFCMKQRSLFQDDNGVDLPIMDKLRAEIEDRKGKIERGEIKNTEESKTDKKENDSDIDVELYNIKQEGEKLAKKENLTKEDENKLLELSKKQQELLQRQKELVDSKRKESEKYDDDKAYEEYQKLLMKENPTDADNSRIGELVKEHYKHSKKEWIGGKGLKELNAAKDDSKVLSNGKTVKEVREQYGIKVDKKETDPKRSDSENKPSKSDIERSINKLQMSGLMNPSDIQSKIDKYKEIIKKGEKPAPVLDGIKENIRILESDLYVANEVKKYSDLSTYDQAEKLREVLLNDKKETEKETYWITDSKRNRLTNEQAKKRIVNSLNENDKLAAKLNSLDAADRIAVEKDIRMNQNDIDNLMGKLNPDDRSEMKAESTLHYNPDAKAPSDESEKNRAERIEQNKKDKDFESESEKHQNRSDAMKGNQNAYKGKAIENAVEKYATDKKIKATVDKISVEDFSSTDESRTHMNGVHHADGYDIATDGKIISMIKSDYPDSEEGKTTSNKTYKKTMEKKLKNLNKLLIERENELKELGEKEGKGTNVYRMYAERVSEVKKEIEETENNLNSDYTHGQFPNYKKVIPSVVGNDIEQAKGFDDFNKILKVAKVAAAYKKNHKREGISVKVGDFNFNPDMLLNAVAMAEKHGLKNVNFRPNSYNPAQSPVEFSGDNGYVVIMPTMEDTYVFNADTGDVGSKYAEYTNDADLEKFLSGDSTKESVKKALFDLIDMLDESEDEETDFEDNDASQPDLFNSPAYKVSAALDSVFGCR